MLSSEEVLGHLHHAILVLDEVGTVLQQDGRLPGLLGYGDEDLVGHHALEFVAPSDHELVAFVFADDGIAVARSWFQPYNIGLLDRFGATHQVRCESQALTVDGQRIWLVTLRSHRLQSSSFRATQAHHADASALEVASTIAASLSDDWLEQPQISSFVVTAHDSGRFTAIGGNSRTAPSALAQAFEAAVAEPAPWNSPAAGVHVTVPLSSLPDRLAAVAAEEGYTLANVAIARFDGQPRVGLVSFGRYDLAFSGNINQILQESLDIIEMTLRREHSDNDPLTGLGNRRRFTAAIGRQAPNTAVLYIDLDRFKQINDTFGHSVGDAVLVETARRISSVCRASDVVARLGGDEFAVLLADVEHDAAVEISQRMLAAISEPLPLEIGPRFINASAGLATSIQDCPDPVDRADHAMLDGKRAGRNRLVVASS